MIMPQELDSLMVLDPVPASSPDQFCSIDDVNAMLLAEDLAQDAPPPPLAIAPAAAAPAAPSPPAPLTLQRIPLQACSALPPAHPAAGMMSELGASNDNVYVLGCEGAAFAVNQHADAVLELIAVGRSSAAAVTMPSAFAAFFRAMFGGRQEARIVVAPRALGDEDLHHYGFVPSKTKRAVGAQSESGIAALLSHSEHNTLKAAATGIDGNIVYFASLNAYAPPPTLSGMVVSYAIAQELCWCQQARTRDRLHRWQHRCQAD